MHLDGRPLLTPSKSPLIVPQERIALAIAEEWQAQTGEIDPEKMPVTRTANAAIDKVRPQFDAVVEQIAAYADTDLLCYRAEAPKELRERQAKAWDPLLDWAADAFGARLISGTGVIHIPQDTNALSRLRQTALAMDSFQIAAFHDLVGLSGSFVIGLAATRKFLPIEELWKRSRVDEDWQVENWGVDEIADRESTLKFRDFLHANRFFDLARHGE